MAFEAPLPLRAQAALPVLALAALLGSAGVVGEASAQANSAPKTLIYSCVDGSGKKLTSDRPIAECTTREQRVHNSDGSLNRVMPPTMTTEERAAAEAREREAEILRSEQKEAARRERNLILLYPNEDKHNVARAKALDEIRNSVRTSEARIAALKEERKPLLEDAEFYVNKPMPSKLKFALDANDATLEATRATMQLQQADIGRINAKYDVELARLRKLWAGAPPGSSMASAPSASLSTIGARPAQR